MGMMLSCTRYGTTLRCLLAIIVVLALGTPIASISISRAEESTPQADTNAPTLSSKDDFTVAATDGSGAVVPFELPTAQDDRDGSLPVSCAPGSNSLFALGATTVTCTAKDAAGNTGVETFVVTVTDQTPPSVAAVENITVDAKDESGAVVDFAAPSAYDNVNGQLVPNCAPGSGSRFPIGSTTVTCSAQDAAGHVTSTTFTITVNALPTPTEIPTATPTPTDEPDPTKTPEPTKKPTGTETPTGTAEPTETSSPTATPTETPIPTPTPAALALPESPPGNFALVGDGGPLGVLSMIWADKEFPVSQEFGHTAFSVSHSSWYAYGRGFGLDGFQHTGLDIGMPAGTYLYSPVEGEVIVAGGTPYFTFYGNGNPQVGELRIQTEDGHQVILGHMGRIAVKVGDKVEIGQFVGLSGGENGDHLHLEIREKQEGGGYRIISPRASFIMDVLEDELARRQAKAEEENAPFDPENPADHDDAVDQLEAADQE